MQDLQEVTQEVHYENYRSERLAKGAPVPPRRQTWAQIFHLTTLHFWHSCVRCLNFSLLSVQYHGDRQEQHSDREGSHFARKGGRNTAHAGIAGCDASADATTATLIKHAFVYRCVKWGKRLLHCYECQKDKTFFSGSHNFWFRAQYFSKLVFY